jgi:hypothetical protein
MAGKSDAFETDLLNLIFKATGIANIADNAAASPLTNLFIALHTADPTDAGNQSSNEVSYTGYARVAVARGAGWTVTGNQVVPAANIDFGQCTAGTATATNWSVGVAVSGATKILYAGAITPSISIANGVIPRLTVATNITED